MRLEEVRIGERVRIAEKYRVPELRGMVGKVSRRYGDAEYPALEVNMDDGDIRLFWFHELEKLEEGDRRGSWLSSIFRCGR